MIIYGRKLNQEYYFFIYVQFLIIFKISLSNLLNLDNSRIINNNDSEIYLIMKGNGNKNILNNDFQYEPSEVIVNGYKNISCKKSCFFIDDINNITLKFSNQIYSAEKMFEDMKNILEIYLTNFDSSQITSMHKMFSGCSNLVSVILPNSNTYNLKNISYMFCECVELKKINFGNMNTSLVETMESLFSKCSKISSIDLSELDTSKVQSM